VFSLVEELQGCDFKRAQKYLAALARVELPAGAKMTRWERQRLAQEQAEHGRKREKVDSTSDDLEQMERRERAECCRLLHFCDDVVNLPGRWTEAQWRLAAIAHEVRRDLLCEYTLLSFAAVRQRVRYLRADELTRTGMLRAVRNAGGVTTDDGHFIEVEVMT
jgi:Arc/MetJ-type ribon-helix-helix transcriptional regulator